jgi:hypothetical protein
MTDQVKKELQHRFQLKIKRSSFSCEASVHLRLGVTKLAGSRGERLLLFAYERLPPWLQQSLKSAVI